MVLTMKLRSGTAAEARMDETIIFKLFTKREKLVVWIRCLMHWSCWWWTRTRAALPPAPTRAAPQISAALFFGRNNLRDETHSHIWSDTRQLRAASAWSWRIHCLPPSQSMWHPLGEHCSLEKLLFTPSFLFPWLLNPSWLQLTASSLAGALHFPYNSTAQWDSHLSSARLWCCNHCTEQCSGTPAGMCSRKKRLFFSKNAKYKRACSAQDCRSIWLGRWDSPPVRHNLTITLSHSQNHSPAGAAFAVGQTQKHLYILKK